MINFADGQRRQIVAAAAALMPAARMVFIRDVEATLSQHCIGRVVSNNDVQRAINSVLDSVAWPKSNSVFMCDSKQQTTNFTEEATTMSNFDPTMAARVRAERARALDNDDDDFETLADGTKVLRDQGVMRTRMAAMDSADAAQRAAAEGHYARRFGLRDAADLRRPGFRPQPDATARDAKLQAYDAYEKHLATAYLSPHAENTGVGSQGPRETRSVGDRCLIQGQNGHLYEADDGSLVCVPDQWGDAALDDRAIEHARYIDHITNAWRHPDGDVVSDHRPAQRADVAPTRDAVEAAYAAYDAEIQERWRNPT